jgi:hypothetical protein
MQPAIVAAGVDLIFAVRIEEAAKRAGYAFHAAHSAAAAVEAAHRVLPEWIVVDLAWDPGLTVINALKADPSLASLRTLGYVPHVDVDLRRRAELAGFDLVLPRSKFVTEFPRMLSCATA